MKPRNSSLIKESHIFFLILNKAALISYKTNTYSRQSVTGMWNKSHFAFTIFNKSNIAKI